MKLDDQRSVQYSKSQLSSVCRISEVQAQSNLSKSSLASQAELSCPKPSLFNFIIFLFFILSLSLFHYNPQNQRIIPLTPLFFQQQIFAGQVHYSRILVQYWEHRIMMIKAMGLNALSVYVMWNFHQIQKGIFDYQTENRNLTLFLELAIKHNMKVLFRPGPYVCAQWDLGGFPARLLTIQNLTLRSSNPKYIQQVTIYFSSLAPIIRPYIRNPLQPQTHNNPISMLQIQNEYGFYGTDKSYISTLRNLWKQLNIHCEEYYVDWIENIKSSYWQGANVGINNGYGNGGYYIVSAINKQGIVFGGEIYSGWYKKWGQSTGPVSTVDKFIEMYKEILQNNHSFSVYLVHGGTNFELTAGANHVYNSQTDYGAVTTSYDYESPIRQNGNITQKYIKFRQLIQSYIGYKLPPIPQVIQAMNTENFTLIKSQQLISSIKLSGSVIKSSKFYRFQSNELQMFHQGTVLYCTTLIPRKNYDIQIEVHDFALVYLNDQLIKVLNRSSVTEQNVNINCGQLDLCSVEIFVESMGHINFGHEMQTDFKGLIKFNFLQKQQSGKYTNLDNLSLQWNMHKLDLRNQPKINPYILQKCLKSPCLFHTQIQLNETHDTFIDMSNYQKGYVWVNGYNLGRYWNIGPQYRLYCPGVWLKKGKNTIVILDLLQKDFKQINGKYQPL